MPSDQWPSMLLRTFDQFLDTLGAVLPKILLAVALIAAGIIIARVLRRLVLRLGADLDRLIGRLLGHRLQANLLHVPWPVSRILAESAYWLAILFFVTATVEVLGFPGMADWISRFAGYLPVLLAAAGIVVLALVAAALAREAVAALPLREAALLARASYLLIVTVGIIIGIDQLGVEIALLANVVTIAAAALLGSIGLAFGLGARATVSNIIAAQYVRGAYAVGQYLRIGTAPDAAEGAIVEITATTVVLDGPAGRVVVPCSRFDSSITVVSSHAEQADA
ncbi:MAG: hypothetical protein WD928_14735 [Gammaproteobacteria bacterium]